MFTSLKVVPHALLQLARRLPVSLSEKSILLLLVCLPILLLKRRLLVRQRTLVPKKEILSGEDRGLGGEGGKGIKKKKEDISY